MSTTPEREALAEAIKRMDRARNILTDGKPTPMCNWGMLATEDLKPVLAATPPAAPAQAIPADVQAAAKQLVANGYRGPLFWAQTVIDWVASQEGAAK